jgi:membrane protein YqaA with SNARE-associated domain
MTILMLLVSVIALAFCGAIVPIGPLEVFLAITVTTSHLGWPAAAAIAAAAALGQVSGKFVVFQCARRGARNASRLATRLRDAPFVRQLCEADAAHPRRLVTVVAASSFIGIPPFAIVVPIAAAGEIRKRTFFLSSVAGRLTRFLLIALPLAV